MGNLSSSSLAQSDGAPTRDGRNSREGKDHTCCNDPRSPSKGVSRTPLKIMEKQQQNIDPRSPSMCVQRTPIEIVQLKVNNESTANTKLPERLALSYDQNRPQK